MATATETEVQLIELTSFGLSSVDKSGTVLRGSGLAESDDSDHDHDRDIPSVPSTNDPAASTSPPVAISKLRAIGVVVDVCVINFLSSFTNGTIVVGLPTIAHAISLSRDLYVWPSSVYGLTSGAALLLAGAVADLIGAKHVELFGILIVGVFTLACGFAQTGIQLVIFRAMQGVGMSMHLSASVALVAACMPQGKGRNISFGCLGLSQPLGFSFGLVISGILIQKLSWRVGFYLCGGGCLLALVVGIFLLPKPPPEAATSGSATPKSIFSRLASEIDWVGGLLASVGLSLLSYVLAELSVTAANIAKPAVATLLPLGCIMLISFPFWIRHRERIHRSALIPNAIWRRKAFTCTCVMVALVYGSTNAMELFSSLYFQDIQYQSTLFTSLRLLPNCLVGTLCNFVTGAIVDRLSARWLVSGASLLSAVGAVLMAVVHPRWPYWYAEFWAQALSPLCADVLFTVGLLVVSREFPEKTQGLAGGVFNTAAQFGLSLGVGLCQLVASLVGGNLEQGGYGNMAGGIGGHRVNEHLLHGYRAAFWTMFAFCMTCVLFAVGGLNKAGKLGLKAA